MHIRLMLCFLERDHRRTVQIEAENFVHGFQIGCPDIRFIRFRWSARVLRWMKELSGGLADDHTVFQVHAQGMDQTGAVCLVVIHQPDDGVVIYFIQVVMVQVPQEMIGNLTQIGSPTAFGD